MLQHKLTKSEKQINKTQANLVTLPGWEYNEHGIAVVGLAAPSDRMQELINDHENDQDYIKELESEVAELKAQVEALEKLVPESDEV